MKKILFILMTCFIYTMTYTPLAQATSTSSGDRALTQLTSRHGSFLNTPSSKINDRENAPQRVILYTVSNGITLDKSSTATTAERYKTVAQQKEMHDKIWQRFIKTVPATIRQNVTQFLLYTDGHGGNLAYVQQMAVGSTNWRLAIDYKDALANPTALYATIVHEASHLFALQNSEKMLGDENACKTVAVFGECMKKNSYIAKYYDKFWKGKTMKDWETYGQSNRSAFYKNYSTAFVNSYAATSVSEDFSETFTYFVFSEKPKNAKTIRNQKLRYFYTQPELVALRNVMLTNIAKHY